MVIAALNSRRPRVSAPTVQVMAAATDLPWIDPAEPLAATGRAVITTDPPAAVPSWNRAAQHRSGWTAAEAIGRDIAELTVPEVGQEVAADIMARGA